MKPERWQQLKEVFEGAFDKDPSQRAAYLEGACRSDPTLRKEVEALLESLDHNTFLETPVYKAAPELFETETDDFLIGTQLGPYSVTRRIGRGGMGIVYLAQDTRLDRPVAIKMLAPSYTSDTQQRERLRREARAAARLSHAGIATVYALEEFDHSVCIVSEYVPGCTLRQILSEETLSFAQILDISAQIVRALAAAHAQGIVHRDLKPENIMRTESGDIKILDFGLARMEPRDGALSGASLTRTGMFLGTPAYASPEQLRGAEVDRATDLFSFGVLIYELAAKRHPFSAQDPMSTAARILDEEAAPLTTLNSEIPAEFDRIIRRCLSKNPADRYHSTQDLLIELEQVPHLSAARPMQGSRGPLWWWQFHQAFAGFGYYGMLYPLWWVRERLDAMEGSLLFFPALVAVGIAANLRLHLWFTSRFYRGQLESQRRTVSNWIRFGDWLFVFMLAVTAVRIHTVHAIVATLLMSVAVGSLVGFLLIEPATARAALDRN
ncbi:MAG: serine/threonine-protein kinase [Acidobacteriota bacterium]|nr:serine/threonine-protein kinase [Acidobacteriota bacterium]